MLRMKVVPGKAETINLSSLLRTCVDSASAWNKGCAEYYDIADEFVKRVFARLHTGGSTRPDEEVGSDNSMDMLPCVLEPRHAIRKACKLAAEHDKVYQDILALPAVQVKSRPDVSAFAIYIQHLMNNNLKILRPLADQAGLRTMGCVFDSIYVMAECEGELGDAFVEIAKRAHTQHGLKVALKSPEGEVLKRWDP